MEGSLPTSRRAKPLMRRRGHELITAPCAGFDFNQEISLYRKGEGVQRDSVFSIWSNNRELHEPS
jgi:hypothetical protein